MVKKIEQNLATPQKKSKTGALREVLQYFISTCDVHICIELLLTGD